MNQSVSCTIQEIDIKRSNKCFYVFQRHDLTIEQ